MRTSSGRLLGLPRRPVAQGARSRVKRSGYLEAEARGFGREFALAAFEARFGAGENIADGTLYRLRTGAKGIKKEQLYLELQIHGDKGKEQVESLGIRAGDPILLKRPSFLISMWIISPGLSRS